MGREPAGGHPLGAAVQPAEPPECGPVDAALRALRQQVTQSGGERDGGQGGAQFTRPAAGTVVEVTGEQFADGGVLLGAGDQPRRRITRALGGLTQHPEGIGVHRAHQRLAHHRAARLSRARGQQPAGQLRADVGGQPGGREKQHRLRVAAVGDEGNRRVDQPGGLAGARPPHDANGCHRGMRPEGSDIFVRSASDNGEFDLAGVPSDCIA